MARGRRGFSLLELMIAIVVLGLGMVLVATMFPLAIDRARRLSEYTKQRSITEAAETTIQLMGQVDGQDFNTTSFAGDLVFDPSPPIELPSPTLVTFSDTRVHYLHMENVTVENRRFVPDRIQPWTETYAPWRLDWPDFFEADTFVGSAGEIAEFCGDETNQGIIGLQPFCEASFIAARIQFESRVYPPLRPRDNVSLQGAFDVGDGASAGDVDTAWDESLTTRRFCWGVFHRLKRIVGPRRPGVDDAGKYPEFRVEAASAVNMAREFDMFYVTLRRPQSTLRSAPGSGFRANVNFNATTPYMMPSEPADAPQALDRTNDVLFPEPWRVQIELPETLPDANETDPALQPTGVPTVVAVPPSGISASGDRLFMLTSMFQQGTQFIDELTGAVYRVVRVRLAADESQAFLTLDREITLQDVDFDLHPNDTSDSPPCPGCNEGVLDINERLRTVWVFPPPVLPQRTSDVPVFDGPQPVVGIEVRPFTVTPRS